MNISEASLEQMRTTAIDLAMRFGPKVLVAVVILTIGVMVSRWISRSTAHALARFELEPPVRLLLARCVWLLSFALFLVIALENLGVELLPVIAGVGVAGAGVALATQGVLSSLVAGLTIIFTKPFRVGEYISIVGEEGTVQTISLFSTTLGHPDRSRIVIPNRKVVGEILHNFGNVRQVTSPSESPTTPTWAAHSMPCAKSCSPIRACSRSLHPSSSPRCSVTHRSALRCGHG